jgi:serine/threonine-protein kinase HipA
VTTIPVRYETALVGRIALGESGPSFAYDERWVQTRGAFPISLRMPIAAGLDHGPEVLLPWLANLLPESEQLAVVGRNLGIAATDVVGLLGRIGRDTAGALSFGDRDDGGVRRAPGYRKIPKEADLERIINELPKKPFLAGEDGVSMSLAGVQDKLPVALVDGGLAIPINGAPSTHILKPDNRQRLYGSVQNEALCMTLARRCGLAAAEVTTGRAGERSFLLVTRYDRIEHGGRLRRLHQEDFCQALGRLPSAKYERNRSGMKGPSLAEMFGLLDRHMTAADRTALLDAVVFNVLICNTDSHAKNYGVLLSAARPRLAPLYDLMCGAAWNVTRNLPQTIGGKDRGEHIYARHWERMAKECGLSPTMLHWRVDRLIRRALAELPRARAEVEAMPAGGHPMLDQFVSAIAERCRTVRENLNRG